MSAPTRPHAAPTLEEFLRRPDVDESPALEFLDGRIERKAVPRKKHSLLTMRLTARLNEAAEPIGRGLALPELRCTYAGRSIVPDVAFLLTEHIDLDDRGEPADETLRPPDLHVEILSPDQSSRSAHERLSHSTSHGCLLGWFFDPYARTIDVYRPGRPPERLGEGDALEGDPVLPGFRLPAAEVFGWLSLRPPAGGADAP